MTHLLRLLVLTAGWVAVSGSVSPHNIVFGLALSALALFIVREQMAGMAAYRIRPLALLLLGLLFLRELALSAWHVTITVLRPRMALKPGIFAFPLSLHSDIEITLLANLITLTPGTLSVDVSADRRLLYVHALDCADPDALRRSIAEGFERRIREAFRR